MRTRSCIPLEYGTMSAKLKIFALARKISSALAKQEKYFSLQIVLTASRIFLRITSFGLCSYGGVTSLAYDDVIALRVSYFQQRMLFPVVFRENSE